MPQRYQCPFGSSTCSGEQASGVRVANFDEVIGDCLDHLAAAADVRVRKSALESLAKRPVDQRGLLLKLARGRLPRRFTGLHAPFGKFPLGARVAHRRRVQDQEERLLIRPAQKGIAPADRSCNVVMSWGDGTAVPRLAALAVRRRIAGGIDRPSPPDREPNPARHDRLPDHGSRPDARKPAKERQRWRARPALPPAVHPPRPVPPRDKPMADNNRYVRTGPQVGQDHCRQTHGETRLVFSLSALFGSRRALPGRPRSRLDHFNPSLSGHARFGQIDVIKGRWNFNPNATASL